MVAWKLSTVAVATVLLATSALKAEDGTMTVVTVGSAEAVAPAVAHGVMAMRGGYWLGVVASRPSPALQAQLNLSKDQGIVVEGLEPESPAAKAGVKQYDILLKGNDKPLSGLHDLFELVNQVKDGKLKLELLRAGKHETVTVTPVKRPEHAMGEFPMVIPEATANGLWISRPVQDLPEPGTIRFRVIGPGQILPPGGPMLDLPGGPAERNFLLHIKTKLADGSSVEINRHGAEPAKITVTHNKDKWEATSSDLSKLPEKIRSEVEKLLHPAFDRNEFYVNSAGPIGYPGGPAIVARAGNLAGTGMPAPFAVSPDVERRLCEMQKQIDALRQSVDALQGKEKKKTPKSE